jgi:very-long-chain enoyl-CoA reductase
MQSSLMLDLLAAQISAALVSYFINHPQYWAPNSPVVVGGFAAALVCQLGNLRCHLMLSRLRKPGDGSLAIPRGFLFDYVTCPNYTCEVGVGDGACSLI